MDQDGIFLGLHLWHSSARLPSMNMQTHLASLRDRLRACKATNAALSAASSGVLSKSWISKFRAGHMNNPRVDTLAALDRALAMCEEIPSAKTPHHVSECPVPAAA